MNIYCRQTQPGRKHRKIISGFEIEAQEELLNCQRQTRRPGQDNKQVVIKCVWESGQDKLKLLAVQDFPQLRLQ
ncbi:CLUMA_CG021634, isoform A [Clunio marinus]|uniref:CLUMA_CG021634, isoform A n=1 Tax=Clunio marinus TaxID=568069 RepID=A0A1J1J8H9_9DIPT|nr:CLUMA_CG021634, isoform A [Clunio marinus]